MTRTSSLAVMAAGVVALLALAGCTAGSDDATDALDGGGADGPTLYLNVTADGQTHRFSTADLPGGSGDDEGGAGDDGDGGADVEANATSSSGTVTASGNATAGNGTAQGNATAGNGTAQGNATAGNGTEGGGMGGVPSGDAPLDVVVEIGASGLPEDELVNWTVRWGDAASATAGNGSAQGSANGTAARQQAQESGSSLPMRLQHQYTSAGRHDLSFAVTVAGQAIDTLRTVVVVADGSGAGSMPAGSPLGNKTEEFTGSFAFSDPLCGIGGSEEFDWTFDETFNGTPSAVQRIVVTAETEGVADLTLTLVDENGTELASGPELDETGPFPAGLYTLIVESCGSANASFVVTAVQDHVST